MLIVFHEEREPGIGSAPQKLQTTTPKTGIRAKLAPLSFPHGVCRNCGSEICPQICARKKRSWRPRSEVRQAAWSSTKPYSKKALTNWPAWVAHLDIAFSPEVQNQFAEIGERAMEGSFASHVVRAVLAGWLIALMVWVLRFAESARFWVMIVLSYVQVSWSAVFLNYFVPTFVGNINGGVALVAAINHAQVFSGKKGKI